MRFFLDANVLFTAAYSRDGRSRALFRLAEIDACSLVSSRHAIEEARRNLSRKAAKALPNLDSLLVGIEEVPEADPRLLSWAEELGLPASDAPILTAAVASRATHLVTGDHCHFGALYGRRPGSVLVVTPAEALNIVLASVDSSST